MNRVKNCDGMEKERSEEKGKKVFTVNQDDNIIVRWYDKKVVNLLSSFVGIKLLGNVKCWVWKSKNYTMVPRPEIVETYNKFMGWIDLLDLHRQMQGLRRQSLFPYPLWKMQGPSVPEQGKKLFPGLRACGLKKNEPDHWKVPHQPHRFHLWVFP